MTNITPIDKKTNANNLSGNPSMSDVGKSNKGKKYKLQNTPIEIKFSMREYYLPGDMEISEVSITINRDELAAFVSNGAKWEQLENYYQVSQTNLKEHFNLVYNQATAKLQMELLASMKETAITGTSSMQKWLSQQWLGMSEVVKPTVEETLTEEQINEQLNAIFNKGK